MASTVLVTGASAGFGAAMVRRWAKGGARVIAAARRVDRVQALADELGPAVFPVQLDVQDRVAVNGAVESLLEEFEAIDVLVNNAGLARGAEPAQEADLDGWQQMLDTNCTGLLHCTRAVLPAMVARGRGHVVNIGSIAATYPYPGANVYGATKAFVRQFSLNLRSDLHGTGVRVTCIEPGLGNTDFYKVRDGNAEKADAMHEGTQPLTAQDIADAAVWAVGQPPHVNVNTIELMPVVQSFGALPVHRPG